LPERRWWDVDRCAASDTRIGLQLRSDRLSENGRAWYWVAEVQPRLPSFSELSARCHDFLVDDDCGREVGVVENVATDPDKAVAASLQVVQSWGRHRIMVSVEEVIEVAPGERRLTIRCRADHRNRHDEDAGVLTAVKSLVARLSGGRLSKGRK
jgi:hypothetical protein